MNFTTVFIQIVSLIFMFYLTPSFGCGRISDHALSMSGSRSKRVSVKYPWHAALYRTGEGWTPNYAICGGALVDHNKVITVAHCVADREGKLIKENQLSVVLGKVHSKWNITEKHQQNYEVSKIIIHEEYRGISNNYLFDIAVIVLKDNVTFSGHIAPACLDLTAENITSRQLIHTAGWGYDEVSGAKRNNLREVALSYIDGESCKDISEAFKPYVTTDKFCALPTSDSSSFERVDSGHGITLERNGQHFLIGLISIQQTNGKLRSNTAVSSHASWIEDILDKY